MWPSDALWLFSYVAPYRNSLTYLLIYFVSFSFRCLEIASCNSRVPKYVEPQSVEQSDHCYIWSSKNDHHAFRRLRITRSLILWCRFVQWTVPLKNKMEWFTNNNIWHGGSIDENRRLFDVVFIFISIVISMSVCLSVCLLVRTRILKTTCPYFTKFSVHVTCGRGSILLWRQCDTLCTSGIVDDVVFSYYNGGNRPESKITRMFRPVRMVAAPGRSLSSPTASCFWDEDRFRKDITRRELRQAIWCDRF